MVKASLYQYQLPENLIAKAPASPRDSSRLFVYDVRRDKITFDIFRNLDRYLPENSFLVLNKTKVLPARIGLRKETGGRVQILFLMNELQKSDRLVKGLSDRKIIPGQKLIADAKHAFVVEKQDGKIFYFRPDFPLKNLPSLLRKSGTMPIPPYIKGTPLSEENLRKKYQTIFAEQEGSVAAPTASLHFTDRVFENLKRKNIPHYFVTLHVGLGTFAPIGPENIKKKKLFDEWYEIETKSFQRINILKQQNKKLFAVGTTSVRTLESYARNKKRSGKTDIFIMPPHKFRLVDGLLTNFHIPGSSLMMLVEAFLQNKKSRRHLRDLYGIAIENKFRFYSFGDAMLILS